MHAPTSRRPPSLAAVLRRAILWLPGDSCRSAYCSWGSLLKSLPLPISGGKVKVTVSSVQLASMREIHIVEVVGDGLGLPSANIVR